MPAPAKAQTGLTFQDIAKRLLQAKLKRLHEIKKAYPHIPLEKLPANIKREAQDILQSAINASSGGQGQTGQSHALGRQAYMNYSWLFYVIGTDLEDNTDAVICQRDRPQGLYIIGTTGTGKSTLLANLILTDIKQGLGVCLIEPHGDLTNNVLAGIPASRLSDVLYLDMTDSTYPFGLNLFQCPEPRTIDAMAKTVSFVHHVFEKLWGAGTDTPRLMQVLRALTRTLMENPGTTFAEAPLLFSSDTVRAKMAANLTNDAIVSFWEDFNLKSPRLREEYIESTKNKIMSFIDEPMVRNIVAQSETTINFRDIMDSEKILLVKLSPQFKEVSLLIGAVIIGKLLMAAWSREDIDEDRKRQFNLYCDEYQRFATSDLRSFIDEARKFRVAITLSHQSLSQLDEENRNAATGAANMIIFRVTGEDGKELAKNFDTTPVQVVVGEDPERAPVSDVIGHLVSRGHNNARVTRFSQGYLQNFEDFMDKKYDQFPPKEDFYGLDQAYLTRSDIQEGRELLNDCLYRCMATKSADFQIPLLALYIMAIAKWDGSVIVLDRYVKKDWFPIPPRWYRGFREAAEWFGKPNFVKEENIQSYLTGFKKKDKANGEALVNMVSELRHTMDCLAKNPILIDTGQYKPKKQDRTYADMENEIVSRLTQQPNFQAKIKMLSGEHDIRTHGLPGGIPASGLTARINQIKAQMRAKGHCKHYLEVEKEIRERQDRWKDSPPGKGGPGGPPPTHI